MYKIYSMLFLPKMNENTEETHMFCAWPIEAIRYKTITTIAICRPDGVRANGDKDICCLFQFDNLPDVVGHRS